LLTDILFAFSKREYFLNNGVILDASGKIARLELAFD